VEVSTDRCLWGTDFPHPNPTHEADEADLVDLIPLFAPDPAQQRRLLVDNPARLYGFE
jgi:predicted TIM-barrel fold metal-dependent hydrolase